MMVEPRQNKPDVEIRRNTREFRDLGFEPAWGTWGVGSLPASPAHGEGLVGRWPCLGRERGSRREGHDGARDRHAASYL